MTTRPFAGAGSRAVLVAPAVTFALLLLTPPIGRAQVSRDTSRAATTTGDSARRAAGDSSGAPSADRVPPASGPGSVGPGSPGPGTANLPINVGVRAPTDTTLARACAATPPGREAPGLLAVVFRTGTSDRDRIAAAKAVGGSLAGTSAYGEEYVRLEVGAGPLAAVADRLIRQDPVVRVSPAPCPPPPAPPPAPAANPPATNPADSARAGRPPARTSP